MPESQGSTRPEDEGQEGGKEGRSSAGGGQGRVTGMVKTTQPAVLARMEAERQLCERAIAKVMRRAVRTVAGLYEEPLNPDGTPNKRWNKDADKTWNECSVKTRASLQIIKGLEQRNEGGDKRPLGVIVLQARAASASEWEAEAKRVDEAERRRAAIDVEVVK